MEHPVSEQIIIRYLLGEASEDEQHWLENQFEDEELFEQCQRTEDALIDDYLLGYLSIRETELFKKNFLTSERRQEKVNLAQSLIEYCDQLPQAELAEPKPDESRSVNGSHWIWSLLRPQLPSMAVILALVILAVTLFVRVNNLQREVRQIQNQLAAQRLKEEQLQRQLNEKSLENRELDEKLAEERESGLQLEKRLAELNPPQIAISTFTLQPGATRDAGELQKIVIQPGTRSIKLRLALEQNIEPDSYRVLLKTADLEPLMEITELNIEKTDRGNYVVMSMSSTVLAKNQYVVILQISTAAGEFENVAQYGFQVIKKH